MIHPSLTEDDAKDFLRAIMVAAQGKISSNFTVMVVSAVDRQVLVNGSSGEMTFRDMEAACNACVKALTTRAHSQDNGDPSAVAVPLLALDGTLVAAAALGGAISPEIGREVIKKSVLILSEITTEVLSGGR